MKRSIVFIMAAIIGYSGMGCGRSNGSGKSGNAGAATDSGSSSSFDLSALTFKQQIQDVVKQAGLKMEDGNSSGWTLAGYKIFESTDPKMLEFDGAKLAGKAGDSVNKVLIHYALKDKTVKLIEIKVFSAAEIKALRDALDKKLGKALYPIDAYTTVFSDQIRYFERAWADPKSTTGYFFTDALNKQGKEEAGLAIVDYSDTMMSELVSQKAYTSSVELDVDAVLKLMKTKK